MFLTQIKNKKSVPAVWILNLSLILLFINLPQKLKGCVFSEEDQNKPGFPCRVSCNKPPVHTHGYRWNCCMAGCGLQSFLCTETPATPPASWPGVGHTFPCANVICADRQPS